MSTETTVELSRETNGEYTAVEPETGMTGVGPSRAEALADLAETIAALENAVEIAERAASIQQDIAVQKEILEQLLAIQMKGEDAEEQSDSNATEFVELTQNTQQRFEKQDIGEDDVEEAIEWARSR